MKKFLTTLAAAALAVSTLTPAAKAGNTFRDHQILHNAVEAAGVPVLVNPARYCKADKMGGGSYRWITASRKAIMVICQDNGRPGGPEVRWTANDLDTLRHEALHVIQDCLAGGIADGARTGRFIKTKAELARAIERLGPDRARSIYNAYASNGVSESDILLELEAFLAADRVDASLIADDLNRVCR